jgi:hypothetical protein
MDLDQGCKTSLLKGEKPSWPPHNEGTGEGTSIGAAHRMMESEETRSLQFDGANQACVLVGGDAASSKSGLTEQVKTFARSFEHNPCIHPPFARYCLSERPPPPDYGTLYFLFLPSCAHPFLAFSMLESI